jgi:hypothetical protein
MQNLMNAYLEMQLQDYAYQFSLMHGFCFGFCFGFCSCFQPETQVQSAPMKWPIVLPTQRAPAHAHPSAPPP